MSETQQRSFTQGRAEGKAEGKAEGEARALLLVLERRGFVVPHERRERVMGCSDLAVLKGWLTRAIAAKSIEDVFGG